MNLLTQLQAASSKAEVRQPDHRQVNLMKGSKAQSEKALVRYRAVMDGKGWITQKQIENALGYAPTVSTTYLAKLLKEGRVERRNRGGAEKFDRMRGYEWRWK